MTEFPSSSEMDYSNDDYFTKRGIDPDVAARRGYRHWDDTNYSEVMGALYDGCPDYILNWAMFMAPKENELGEIDGITVPRFAPPGFPPLTAGLKFRKNVKNGAPTRHYHGDGITDFSLFPAHVEVAYAVPQKFRVKAYFEHTHNDTWTEVDSQHNEDFHGARIPEGAHGHTFYIIPFSFARSHVQGKMKEGWNGKGGAHKGDNPDRVHVHIPTVKCVYTPSSKEGEAYYNGFDHDHTNMNDKESEGHLGRFGPHTNHQH